MGFKKIISTVIMFLEFIIYYILFPINSWGNDTFIYILRFLWIIIISFWIFTQFIQYIYKIFDL